MKIRIDVTLVVLGLLDIKKANRSGIAYGSVDGGPTFLDRWSVCRLTVVKGKYQQKEEELDDAEEEEELDDFMEVEKQESEN